MNGGGRRQLPSWMLRSSAPKQESISETKGENKKIDSDELDREGFELQMKVKGKEHETEAPLLENKSHLRKKCKARTKERNSNKRDEDQGEVFQQGDEPHLIKNCKASRSQTMSNKQGEDQDHDLLENNMEEKVDGLVRKRVRGNAPGKKRAKRLMKESHDRTVDSIPSEEELTVEDLISIAEEYINADREKELQKSQNLGFDSETKPLLADNTKIGFDKDLTALTKDRKSVTDKPLPLDFSLTNPLADEVSIINPSNTGDLARDMLDLFLGPLLRKSEEMERKIDAMTENMMPDYELNKKNQDDTVEEVVPVMRKQASLKDKVAKILD